MNTLVVRAFTGLCALGAFLALATFLPAWTVHYWRGWLCLGSFFAPALAVTLYLVRSDLDLLKRRMKAGSRAESEKSQKRIQSFTRVFFLALFAIPALDYRFGWSRVTPLFSVAGDVVIIAGFAVVFMVFKENTYTSGVIEVSSGQRVISTGPYALVRHPMYSGALIMMIGIPPALGSWWGLLLLVPMMGGIVWRLLDEEKFLAANLPGYSDYLGRVKRRLLPGIW